jgi:hypothetical protein
MQFRIPAEKGIYELGGLITSLLNLSGLNSSGFSKTLGSRCRSYTWKITSDPFGKVIPLSVSSCKIVKMKDHFIW